MSIIINNNVTEKITNSTIAVSSASCRLEQIAGKVNESVEKFLYNASPLSVRKRANLRSPDWPEQIEQSVSSIIGWHEFINQIGELSDLRDYPRRFPESIQFVFNLLAEPSVVFLTSRC